MKGWSKILKTGRIEMGSDAEVEAGLASWTQGELEELQAVTMANGEVSIILFGEGEFWQSDDFLVEVGQESPRKVVRRVEKKIVSADTYASLESLDGKNVWKISFDKEPLGLIRRSIHLTDIPGYKIGSWFIIELMEGSDDFRFFISKERI